MHLKFILLLFCIVSSIYAPPQNQLNGNYDFFAELLARIEQVESGGDMNAVSRKGAKTSYQLMPSAVADYNWRNNTRFTLDELVTNHLQASNIAYQHLTNDVFIYHRRCSESLRATILGISAYNTGKELAYKGKIKWDYVYKVDPERFNGFNKRYKLVHAGWDYVRIR